MFLNWTKIISGFKQKLTCSELYRSVIGQWSTIYKKIRFIYEVLRQKGYACNSIINKI